MDNSPRKPNLLERFRLMILDASLDRDKNYSERWRNYELEGWLRAASLLVLSGICVVAWFLFKSTH